MLFQFATERNLPCNTPLNPEFCTSHPKSVSNQPTNQPTLSPTSSLLLFFVATASSSLRIYRPRPRPRPMPGGIPPPGGGGGGGGIIPGAPTPCIGAAPSPIGGAPGGPDEGPPDMPPRPRPGAPMGIPTGGLLPDGGGGPSTAKLTTFSPRTSTSPKLRRSVRSSNRAAPLFRRMRNSSASLSTRFRCLSKARKVPTMDRPS